MELLSSKNRGVKYLFCMSDIFIEYAWVKPLKEKKEKKTVFHGFVGIVNKCKRNLKYNSFMPKWLDDKKFLMCSANIEGKSVVAEKL